HVAVVFAGLVGAAEINLVELFPVGAGIALHQRLDRDGGEIVGTHLRVRTASQMKASRSAITPPRPSRAPYARAVRAALRAPCLWVPTFRRPWLRISRSSQCSPESVRG